MTAPRSDADAIRAWLEEMDALPVNPNAMVLLPSDRKVLATWPSALAMVRVMVEEVGALYDRLPQECDGSGYFDAMHFDEEGRELGAETCQCRGCFACRPALARVRRLVESGAERQPRIGVEGGHE